MRGDRRVDAWLRAAAEQGEAAAGWRVHGWPSAHRATVDLWRHEHGAAAAAFRRLSEQAAERGDEASIPEMLAPLAVAEFLAGRWSAATQVATEAIEGARQVGERPYQARALAARARVAAGSGDERAARTDAHAAGELIGERGMLVARIHSASALALLDLAEGGCAMWPIA